MGKIKKCKHRNCRFLIYSSDLCSKHYTKQYYLKNKKRIDKRNKGYYKKHKQQIIDYQRNYTKTDHGRYSAAKRQAKKRGITWSLSKKLFLKLTKIPCHYCQWQLHKNVTGTGLDRINNQGGYHAKNVLPCCGFCNRLRNTILSVEETKVLVETLVKHRKLYMPYYDYECQQCNTVFEIQKRITDESAEACPKCSSEDTKKLISATNFQLKGAGWYAAHQSGSKKK